MNPHMKNSEVSANNGKMYDWFELGFPAGCAEWSEVGILDAIGNAP